MNMFCGTHSIRSPSGEIVFIVDAEQHTEDKSPRFGLRRAPFNEADFFLASVIDAFGLFRLHGVKRSSWFPRYYRIFLRSGEANFDPLKNQTTDDPYVAFHIKRPHLNEFRPRDILRRKFDYALRRGRLMRKFVLAQTGQKKYVLVPAQKKRARLMPPTKQRQTVSALS